MTESAGMANASLTKLLPKTFGPFRVISVTLVIVTSNEKGIHNTVSMDRMTLAPGTARCNDGADQNVSILRMRNNMSEDGADKNDKRIKGEFPVDRIVRQV